MIVLFVVVILYFRSLLGVVIFYGAKVVIGWGGSINTFKKSRSSKTPRKSAPGGGVGGGGGDGGGNGGGSDDAPGSSE